MDAEFLQHSFDPDVAGRCLLVIGVVKGECLIEGKQMLGAVAPGERLRDRLGAGVAAVMAQARQRFRFELAFSTIARVLIVDRLALPSPNQFVCSLSGVSTRETDWAG